MALIKQNLSKPKLKSCYQSSDLPVTIVFNSGWANLTEGSSFTSGIRDANFTITTADTNFISGYYSFESNEFVELQKVTEVNPQIGQLNQDYSIVRNKDGIAKYNFDFGKVTYQASADLSAVAEFQTSETYLSPTSGSLAEHMISGVDNIINDSMTLNDNAKIWSTFNVNGENFVRNTNNWLTSAGVDLTCYAAKPTNGKARVLITPRHMIGTEHANYQIPIGGDAWFVDNSNTLYKRTVLDKEDISSSVSDAVVYLLDSDLPSEITPCKVADDIDNYTKELSNRFPIIGMNQDEFALIFNLIRRTYAIKTEGWTLPSNPPRTALSKIARSGDSGNPLFILVNGELFLISAYTSSVGGTSYSAHVTQINSGLSTLDSRNSVTSNYTVTVGDFSSFPTYGGGNARNA